MWLFTTLSLTFGTSSNESTCIVFPVKISYYCVFSTPLFPLSLPCSFIMNPLSTISQWVKQQPRPCESQGTPNMLKRRSSLTSWVVVSPRKKPFTSTSMYKPDLGRTLPNDSQFRSVGKESTRDVGDPSSIPGSGRSLEEGKATHSSIPA